MRGKQGRDGLLLIFIVAALFLVPGAGAAQAGPGAGVLVGRVMDARTGEGLAAAAVELDALGLSADSTPSTRAEVARRRVTVTGEGGAYRFEGVDPGRYELRVERLGFRPARVVVELRLAGTSRLSVGLEVSPIVLEPVEVRGRGAQPYDRAMEGDAAGVGRTVAVRLRQQRYLSSDVRGLTHGELLESVPLAEADLFRSLQRLPGISTRDDWSAELWTRGASWDETRVLWDGLPLFSPVHGAGMMAGVNSDAVGAVYLHPGVRPARLGEGGVGVLELESRSAGGGGKLSGFGELSLTSLRLAVDRRVAGGRGGWMVAAHRTWLDWAARGAASALGVADAAFPYRFEDVTGRGDWTFRSGTTVTVSGLWEDDRLSGDIPDVLQESRVRWGNGAARATVTGTVAGRWTVRHTLGVTRYGVSARNVPPLPGALSAPSVEPLDHALTNAVLRGEWSPAAGEDGWSAGYELVRQAVDADGAVPPEYFGYRITAPDSLNYRNATSFVGVWGERRWWAGPVELETGLRLEAGPAPAGAGAVRAAPRVLARWSLGPRLDLTAAVGRAYQYAQAIRAIGVPFSFSRTPAFHSGDLWLLAGDSVPALRSDVATLGGELWLGDAWLAGATAYVRRAAGVLAPDPRPGLAHDRPLYVRATERGHGLELSLRRLRGQWTGSLGYTLARTEQTAAGLEYPAPGDRRQIVDATGRVGLGHGFALAAAGTFATGAPYTRVSTYQVDLQTSEPIPVVGEPGARRMASYASLDVMADWTKSFRTWAITGYLQIRNLLGRRNPAGYSESEPRCGNGGISEDAGGRLVCSDGGDPYAVDTFLPAMPRAPLLGARIRF